MGIKERIANNPGASMIVAGLAGLAFPYAAAIPDITIIAFLAGMIFIGCFKIHVPLSSISIWRPIGFCVVRFAIAPVIAWKICMMVAPSYAVGIFLLALCPAGASSAALTGLYNGNVTLALLVTVISSVASVFLIPVMMSTFGHMVIHLPITSMLETLVFCILLPGALYIPLRRHKPLLDFTHHYGRLTTVIIISVMAFIVIAKKRDYFFDHPEQIFEATLVCATWYAVAALIGFAMRVPREDRIAYGVGSAFNNSALGIGLAFMYFDEKTVILLIATEVIWCALPLAMQPIIRRIA